MSIGNLQFFKIYCKCPGLPLHPAAALAIPVRPCGRPAGRWYNDSRCSLAPSLWASVAYPVGFLILCSLAPVDLAGRPDLAGGRGICQRQRGRGEVGKYRKI